MIIKIERTGNLNDFISIINEVSNKPEVKSLIILSCDNNNFTPSLINSELKKISIPIFGGIFPEIIYGKEKLQRGTIVAGLTKKAEVHIISNLSDKEIEYEKLIDHEMSSVKTEKTMFVFVDGFSKRINALLDSLFNIFGLEINYIGGGAGSLSMKEKPCLITNRGLIQDSAILALVDIDSGIGVSHGWKVIEGPFQVTESDGNIIKTLDWQPAFHVYRKIVENHSNKIFTKNNFFDISKCYPFGISKLNSEKIVRDPFIIGKNNSIVCVGEIPEESFVSILTGNRASLIKAAKTALTSAKESYSSENKESTRFLMDCISRVLFLEQDFDLELKALNEESETLIGALTIGEIANCKKDYLEFYNKTAVLGILGV
jgi:hypothetical protein